MPIPCGVGRGDLLGLGAPRELARRALEAALDVLFPPCCAACDRFLSPPPRDTFCGPCQSQIRLARPPFCGRCGRPYQHEWQGSHLCGECLLRPPSFSSARSWACYPRHSDASHPLRQVIHRFKYGRRASLGEPLGRLLAQACEPWFRASELDLMVPVPLHPRRLRWRGFNQSVLLGREVGRAWNLPLDPFVLTRRTETRTQTSLSLKERRPNVRGAFAVAPRRTVRQMRLLLVDDIYTSGATVEECTRVLLHAGARDVQVLTLARTMS